MKSNKLGAVFLLVLVLNVVPFTLGSFIVPEEFATLLGLVFSTIPQVKKGTDSRIGFGYRFGNHADTQIVLELGPQKNTAKLGNPDESSDSFNSKREVNPDDYVAIQTATESRDWIQKWSQHMSDNQREPIILTTARPVAQAPTVQVKPLIAESALKQLVQLYRKPSEQQQQQQQEASSSLDSVVQYQDRHKVFLKRPTPQKLGQFEAQKQHQKKKVTDDLMDVDFE